MTSKYYIVYNVVVYSMLFAIAYVCCYCFSCSYCWLVSSTIKARTVRVTAFTHTMLSFALNQQILAASDIIIRSIPRTV